MPKTLPIEKATKIINQYTKNNFNAYKTLKELGYSEHTSKTAGKKIIKSAQKVILKDKQEQLETTELSTRKQVKNSLEILGISEMEVKEQLKKILFSEDFTNSLKILNAISKDIGLHLTDDNNQKTPPSVSITLENNSNDVIEVKEAETE